MRWTKESILAELRALHGRGVNVSYNALARRRQPLVSAASYHFTSYRSAVVAAGIDYADVIRRPRWTKPRVIAVIKAAKRKGHDLHWSAVTRRRDELGKAAFAAIQKRLFGSWDRAIHAAGLDADEVACYRSWDRNTIAYELRHRQSDGDAVNSGAVQRDDPGLHSAALRYFGSYDQALRAARIKPADVRQRKVNQSPATPTRPPASRKAAPPQATPAVVARAVGKVVGKVVGKPVVKPVLKSVVRKVRTIPPGSTPQTVPPPARPRRAGP